MATKQNKADALLSRFVESELKKFNAVTAPAVAPAADASPIQSER